MSARKKPDVDELFAALADPARRRAIEILGERPRRAGELAELLDGEGRDFLMRTPVFVPHARIAENARTLGLNNIILTDAADAGILAGLRAYNWSA